jgi:iron(III) transport system ATP-binding protein
MLKGIGLTRTIGDRAILDDVSFQLDEGTIATVLGPSGSGKTTLLRLIMGLEPTDAGELFIGDRLLSGPGVHVPAENRGFSMVFQEFTLFPHLNVEANVTFGLERGTDTDAVLDELLALLEIKPLRRRRIDQLSGGEQQRVALARALAVRPRVLLLDEPFSNIDYMLRDRLFERFKAHLTDHGISAILATHDHKEAFYFSEHTLVLRDGAVIDSNPPRLIYQRPRNTWVAEFFGEFNVVTGRQLAELGGDLALEAEAVYLLRPEAFEIRASTKDNPVGTIESVSYFGFYQDVRLRLDSGLVLTVRDLTINNFSKRSRVGLRLRPGIKPCPVPGAPIEPESGTS